MTQFLCKCGHHISLTKYPNSSSGLFVPEINLERYYESTNQRMLDYVFASSSTIDRLKAGSMKEPNESRNAAEAENEVLADFNDIIADVINFGSPVTVCPQCNRLYIESDGKCVSYILEE